MQRRSERKQEIVNAMRVSIGGCAELGWTRITSSCTGGDAYLRASRTSPGHPRRRWECKKWMCIAHIVVVSPTVLPRGPRNRRASLLDLYKSILLVKFTPLPPYCKCITLKVKFTSRCFALSVAWVFVRNLSFELGKIREPPCLTNV